MSKTFFVRGLDIYSVKWFWKLQVFLINISIKVIFYARLWEWKHHKIFFRNLNWRTSPGDNFLKHLPMVRQNIDIKLMVTISILIKIPIMYCGKKKQKKRKWKSIFVNFLGVSLVLVVIKKLIWIYQKLAITMKSL